MINKILSSQIKFSQDIVDKFEKIEIIIELLIQKGLLKEGEIEDILNSKKIMKELTK